jgi:hypothetical protein
MTDKTLIFAAVVVLLAVIIGASFGGPRSIIATLAQPVGHPVEVLLVNITSHGDGYYIDYLVDLEPKSVFVPSLEHADRFIEFITSKGQLVWLGGAE